MDLYRGWANLGRDVQQDLRQTGAGHRVDHIGVHLGHDRCAPVLQTLDEPQLPQRLGSVEFVRHQPTDEFVVFSAPARRWDGYVPYVEIDVEILVLDEPRPVQPERRSGHQPPQLRQLRQTRLDELSDRLEAEIRRIRGIADRRGTDMHVPAGRLGKPESCVRARQPIHGLTLRRQRRARAEMNDRLEPTCIGGITVTSSAWAEAPRSASMRSSSAPAFPACTRYTGCASSGCGRGCLRWPEMSVAHGSSTNTRARDVTSRASSTRTASPMRFSRSGYGRRPCRASPRSRPT